MGGFVLLQVAETPTKKHRRATKAQHALRIDTVYGMLCDGKSRSSILLSAAEMWEVSERTTDDYIQAARKKLQEDSSITREALMAEAFAGYRQVRQSAERRGQLMAALKAIENMTALAGINK
jgi:hypothetical protein